MRLLLCEDEKELSNALVKILEHYQYSVDAAYDGEEALEYIGAETYDAVILDIMMPKMDGLTVLRKVRSTGNLVPIIMLTAKSQIDDKVLGLDSGANDYLAKPFDTKELLARLRAITKTTMEQIPTTLTVGEVHLNRRTSELYTEKHVFKLVKEEFEMMEMLMLNKGHRISEERFMEKIWGIDNPIGMDVVWVYISYLKKKVELLHCNLEITGNDEAGYILEDENAGEITT